MDATPAERRGGADAAEGSVAAEVSQASAGSRLSRANGASSPLAIETRALTKSFGDQPVLVDVNLEVPAGGITVVLGPSGTGKSVLIKHVVGLLRPDGGEVLVRDRPLSTMSRSEVFGLRRDIGVMFQDGALFSSMSLYENVAFPLRQHTDFSDGEIREIALEHLSAVGLAGAAERFPSELSGGMKKRAGLARCLALDPDIVLCDEPDSGLDPVRTALLGELLIERHAELGGTMLVVTHDVGLARPIADYISVMWKGRIVASGATDAVFASEDPFVRQFLDGEAEGPLAMES